MEGFGAKILFEFPLFGRIIPVTETVVNTWIIMAILALFAIIGTRKFDAIPRGLQNLVEAFVDIINKFTAQTMGEKKVGYAPYMGTLFLLLIFSNLFGLFGGRPPTADLNTTFALAIMTFLIIHFNGITKKGPLTYAKGYLEPMAFLLPLNIIGELALPISLAFRLFGNIVGGLIITSLLYNGLASATAALGISFAPILQAGVPVILHLYFDVFAGLIQTFIFIMLSMVFISNAYD